jgi:hypothetical protein
LSESSSTILNQCVECVKCVKELDHVCLEYAKLNCDLNSSSSSCLSRSDNKSSSLNRNYSSNSSNNSINSSNLPSTNTKSGDFSKSSCSETSTHMTHTTQACLLEQQLPLLSILKNGFVCFDFEWASYPDSNGEQKFRAASFVDNNGAKKVLLIEDYERQFGDKAEYAMLIEIVNCLSKYDYCFGWYSSGVEVYDEVKHRKKGKNSDLVMLDKRLKANGISSSIVGYTQSGKPYLTISKHIDAIQIYDKPMVKTTIYKNKYKSSMSLDTVTKAIVGRGKYKGYSGLDFEQLPTLEEKRRYVLEDSQLVFDMLQHNDFEILRLMDAIATLTRLSFETVCRTGVAKMWTKILDDRITREINLLSSSSQSAAYTAFSNNI